MASLGGAKGLNIGDKLSSLTVGKQADLVLYDLTNLSLLPRTDPISLLVLGRPINVVNSAWVNGKQIVADGKVTQLTLMNCGKNYLSAVNGRQNASLKLSRKSSLIIRRLWGCKR